VLEELDAGAGVGEELDELDEPESDETDELEPDESLVVLDDEVPRLSVL
jgi:hypothetical protein